MEERPTSNEKEQVEDSPSIFSVSAGKQPKGRAPKKYSMSAMNLLDGENPDVTTLRRKKSQLKDYNIES